MGSQSVGRYYRISPMVWAEPWTNDMHLLAYYLMTCPHRLTEGLYRLPKAYVLADLKWSAKRLAEPFGQLLAANFCSYDEAAEVVLIHQAMKYQAPENPNQVKAALKALGTVPSTVLADRFRQLAERYCPRLAEALPEGFGGRSAERSAEPIPDPPSPTPTPTPTTEPTVPRGDLANDRTFAVNSAAGQPVRPSAEVIPLAAPMTAQTLVGEWIDHCAVRPPGQVVGQVAKLLGGMLGEGIPATAVRSGLAQWHQAATSDANGRHPSTLPSYVHAAANARAGPAIDPRFAGLVADARAHGGTL
jgi:hypothetical protein